MNFCAKRQIFSWENLRKSINKAVKVWQDMSGLEFVQVKRRKDANLVLEFLGTEHGDKYDFDGPGMFHS